jgi:hypothetical protein
MHIREMDFRKEWLGELFRALKTGIGAISLKLDEVEWFDGINAEEYSESILGIAFVAAQTYIAGTVSDLKEMVDRPNEIIKWRLLSLDKRVIKDNVNTLQLIDATANYFKHHDEWPDWQVTSRNRDTISTLNRCGITKDTEFPCYSAATLLWPEEELGNFELLLDILVSWRNNVITKQRFST